ncbi:hypothetical protein AB1Y20_023597 [Prymnesium parvum]|uniref:Uncharacterized protein n=1 Tax=Prymnesium parvum TaxID=97485 RepID=A0AB34JDY2_PRYPA
MAASPTAAGGGWTFSDSLSADDLAEVRSLIAMNGLAPPAGAADDGAAAAFARLAAAFPNATVIDPPQRTAGGDEARDEPSGRTDDARAGATIVVGPAASRVAERGGGWVFSEEISAERRAEMDALLAANGVSVAARGGAGDAAGDEAFAQMVAEHPGAVEISPGVFACAPVDPPASTA